MFSFQLVVLVIPLGTSEAKKGPLSLPHPHSHAHNRSIVAVVNALLLLFSFRLCFLRLVLFHLTVSDSCTQQWFVTERIKLSAERVDAIFSVLFYHHRCRTLFGMRCSSRARDEIYTINIRRGTEKSHYYR